MTIAIGILTNDGVVVAADSELSVGYDIKGTGDKIIGCMRPQDQPGLRQLAVGISGSGYFNYIQSARFEVMKKLVESPRPNDASVIEEYLRKFYSDHVLPFYPHDREVEFELLIGGRFMGYSFGFVTDKMSIRSLIGFDAVGKGEAYAQMLLSNLWFNQITTDSAVMLASYVVACVKDVIAGCGKKTQIAAVTDGRFTMIRDELIKELDEFSEHHGSLRDAAFKWMIGGGAQSLKDVSRAMKVKRKDSENLLQSIRKMILEGPQT